MKPAVAAFEMSGPASVAVWDGERTHQRAFGDRRGRALLAEFDALLADAGVARTQLRHLIAGTGPGSYTGLRVACAAVQVLGFALGAEVAGLPSVAAAAWPAPPGREAHVLLDAFRNEVYHAAYRRTEAGLTTVVAPRVLAAGEARGVVPDGALLVGDPALCDGAPELLSERCAPHAADLLALARSAARGAPGDLLAAGQPAPLYLRPAAFRREAARSS